MASLIGRRIPRIQEVIIPQLRTRLGAGVSVVSWIPKVEHRVFPMVQVRRLGGLIPVWMDPVRFDRPVIELTAYTETSLEDTEDLLLDARQVIYEMVEKQTVISGAGSLSSYFETLGPTQFDSPFEDTWRIQTLIQLGVRPLRT